MRSLKLLLAIVAIMFCGCCYAYDFEVNGLYYNILSNTQVEITKSAKYKDLSGELILPERVINNGKTYTVVAIGKGAFEYCKDLTGSLIIPNSVTSIGDGAFEGCEGFNGTLTIPISVNSIGNRAFEYCKGLTGSLIIPNFVISIGEYAFEGCRGFNGTLMISNTVNKIGANTFSGCFGLTGYLTIPESVTSIEDHAFNFCRGFSGSLKIPNSVIKVGEGAFSGCRGFTGTLTIPNSVKTIGEYAFTGCVGFAEVISEILVPYDIPSNVFGKIATLIVPKGTIDQYKAIPNWVKSFNRVVEVGGEEIPTESDGLYNKYVTCIYRSSNITQNGSNIQNSVGFEIMNSGNRSIYITKLVTKDPDTKEILATSTDTNILGQLEGGETKVLSVKLKKDIVPIWELTYTYDNKEYSYDNTQYVLLYITANKYGMVKFADTKIGEDTRRFSIMPGADATIEFVPGNGCVLSEISINGTEMTSDIVDDRYIISNITYRTNVIAVFDKNSGNNQSINGHEYVDLGLPSGKYWSTVNYGAKNPEDNGSYLSIHNLGTVSSKWGDYWKSPTKDDLQELLDMCDWMWTELNGTNGFIIKGPNGNTMFLPAAGMHYSLYNSYVGSVAYYCTSTHDDYSRYWIFKGDTSEKEFALESGLLYEYPVRPISTVRNESVFSVDGLNFSVINADEKTASLAKGNYGNVLEVPSTVKYPSTEWKIVGIDEDALSGCSELAAIIWNPDAPFTEKLGNPNLLLYVKSASYAPASIKNVIVNGTANSIVLSEATGKNNFYCPQEFIAKTISYTHNYRMETGLGTARGWETIALPFDVQKISHQSQGEIVPFASWKSGETRKPFWLMTYGNSGWAEVNSIKANTPYIISMPNHSNYKQEYRLNGNVTFSAEDVRIPNSADIHTVNYNGRTFLPNYKNRSDDNCYALNVNNDYMTYSGSNVEGSTFLMGLRAVHPFEAYMTTASQARKSISINDDMTSGIEEISVLMDESMGLRIYNLKGQLIMVEQDKNFEEVRRSLPAGVYIVNGKKLIIK